MKKFNNPLDHIRIASPCPADWNQMYGNDRKRFCADCKLNVYNLSDMSRDQAESFLIASEGRVCVRYFRRTDGTVLTKDCPVGWRALKQRVSRTAAAAFSVMVGILGGLLSVRAVNIAESIFTIESFSAIDAPETNDLAPAELPVRPGDRSNEPIYEMGKAYVYPVAGRVDLSEFRNAIVDEKGNIEIRPTVD